MRLDTSYGQIWKISFPIMLGSAAQNIIVLCDNVFLYHFNNTQFAAVGIVGSLYLVLASIGYGFSRGGQIFIARKYGEREYDQLGVYFQALMLFELILAFLVFAFFQFFSYDFLKLFISSSEILEHCNNFLKIRTYGVFFSYTGVALIALYTGIARPKIILIDTIVLTLSNLFLNYVFVFGHFGSPAYGIEGTALASTISEVIAFFFFVGYMVLDKENRKYHLFNFSSINPRKILDCFNISFPIVLQSAVGLGAYFLFFAFIENNSAKDLEISNLLRNIYLILSIPAWGFSAGINTIVSNFIGNRKRQAVFPMIYRTSLLSLAVTMALTFPMLMFPDTLLYPLFGSNENNLIAESKPYMIILIPIMAIFSIGSVFINGLTGTGHTRTALWIQTLFTIFYIVYSFLAIKILHKNLHWAWSAEILYWLGILIFVVFYLKTNKWHEKKI